MNLTVYLCFLLLHILTTKHVYVVSAQALQRDHHGEVNGIIPGAKKRPMGVNGNKQRQQAKSPNVISKEEDESIDDAGINFEKGMEKWFANTKGARNYDLTEHMVDAVWGLHRRWTTIATKRRKSLNFFQHFAVFLVGTGAILQTLSHSLAPPYEWITSLAAGGFLGVAPFITQHFLSHEKMTAWIVSRATAEALKAEVIKFRAGVRPFHGDDSVEALAMIASKILEPASEYDFDTRMNINNILWSIENSNSTGLARIDALKSASNGFNGNCRSFTSKILLYPPPSLKRTKESYIDWRLKPQVECVYRNGSRKLRKITLLVKGVQNLLAAGSSGIAFIAARSRFMSAAGKEGLGPLTFINARIGNISIWGAVMTTIAAAIGTQFATSKLDEISAEFRDAANSIERNVLIMSSKKLETGTEEWSNFVLECERIIAETTRASKTISNASKKDSSDKNDFVATRKWNPNAECKDEYSGSISADNRAQWLIEQKDYSIEAAHKRIMEEFPDMFEIS